MLFRSTASISVVAVNDPPTGVSKTIDALEDTDYAFSAADFGFSDTADTGAHTLSAIVVQSLPSAGSLKLNGVAVTTGQSIALADFANLKFRGAQDAFGTSYASFTFKLRDSGGTSNGGVDLSASAYTITFNLEIGRAHV